MKQFFPFTSVHIISEPGDLTRYDYIVYKNGDVFHFNRWGSTFAFPEALSIHWVDGLETVQDCKNFIKENETFQNVNPWTLLECVRTMKDWDNILSEALKMM